MQDRVHIIDKDRRAQWYSVCDFVAVAVGHFAFIQQLGISIPLSFLAERNRRVEVGQICSLIAVDKQVAGLLVSKMCLVLS
jgi:hypothetical protein